MVSVIMPVYNTGMILRQTIDSVLAQSFEDFELLLIDDGSTDGSGVICDSYALKDSRIRVIHKKNGGICSARNTGLQLSRGEYITFCDHDDLYLPGLLKAETDAAQEYCADMIVVGKRREEQNCTIESKFSFLYTQDEIKAHLLDILESSALGCVWNVLYKKSILRDITFNEQYKVGHEDYIFNMTVLQKAKIIYAMPTVYYVHIVRENISTSAKIYKEAIPAMVDASNLVFKLMHDYQVDVNKEKNKIVLVHGREILCCLAYAAKTGIKYSEFQSIAESLCFVPIKSMKNISRKDWKRKLVYQLLSQKRLKFLYFILRINNK